MDSSDAATTVHVLGFALGAALCGLLGVMQRRVDRIAGETSGYVLLWVTGFLWTCGSFVHLGRALGHALISGHLNYLIDARPRLIPEHPLEARCEPSLAHIGHPPISRQIA
jgi:hypothetical protein